MSETTQDTPLTRDWQPIAETAPSEMRARDPFWARVAGMFGLVLITLGSTAIVSFQFGRLLYIGPGWGMFLVLAGFFFLFFHAATDGDVQIRRTYASLGFTFLSSGAVLAAVPILRWPAGPFFGVVFLLLGLLFLMAADRHETDSLWHNAITKILGSLGIVMALCGFLIGNLTLGLLLPKGLLLILLGLAFLWAFVALRGSDDTLGYGAGLSLGVVGGTALTAAVARSAFSPQIYLMPAGLVLIGCGLAYLALSIGICSDLRFVVMTRRELAAIFTSPIAYIILFGITLVAWIMFIKFLGWLIPSTAFGALTPATRTEPIVGPYMANLFPIICVIFIVPALTMRLLSEEHRSGTLEVLLTAPLEETSVVLSKFFAVYIFFLLLWIPWGLFLLALRVEGGEPFDYRPVLSLYVVLAFIGANFLSMGLFFSSLVANQISAAILTFIGMLALTAVVLFTQDFGQSDPRSIILTHISWVDLWWSSMRGKLAVRDLFYQLSAAVYWLFLTVKVLESRKWR